MTDEIKIITADLLRSWSACDVGFDKFCQLFPEGADLKTAVEGLVKAGHDYWGQWLFGRCRMFGLFADFTALGYRNSGGWNWGALNSGDRNAGSWNAGDRNAGNGNSGDRNDGFRNSGGYNLGNLNSGHSNSGSWNSGHRNSGHANSGDMNAGDGNSGNWNSGHGHTGCFNSMSCSKIFIFNKVCDAETWNKAYKPIFLFFDLTYWVDVSEMTDKEKIDYPGFHLRGGHLRKYNYKEAFKLSWGKADPQDRIRIKDLPNFDADIFFEISGIDLR